VTGAEPDAKPASPAQMRMPERDNPFAWRAKSKEGRAGAVLLLESLTDDEVARYMGVARDQVKLEERHWVVKAGSAVIAVLLAVVLAWQALRLGFTRWHFGGLGLAFAMGYWPWRVFACRRLWLKHFDAAKAELARRQSRA
jgi:hypothetical protein